MISSHPSRHIAETTFKSLFILVISLAITSCASAPPRAGIPLQEQIEEARRSGELNVAGERIAAVNLLSTLYENNNYRPVWHGSGQQNRLLEAIRASRSEGLNPDDYHLGILERYLSSSPVHEKDTLALELLLSDAFFRLAYHYSFGRSNPEELYADWNFGDYAGDTNPLKLLKDAIDSGDVFASLQKLLPQSDNYLGLKKALAQFRDMAAGGGGWSLLPMGIKLKPGMTHPGVVLLRKRLSEGVYAVPLNHDAADTYDPQLEQAVINFQAHHGIQADGIVGPDTLAALNVPVERRIDQVRINMERLRWVTRGLPQDYLLVDIAGYRVLLYQDGQQTWSTRAVVGTPDRRTPVFRSAMSYFVLNPTWTVPQTILREDILPAVKKNPAALGDKGLKVIDSNGQEVDPASVDWNMFSASGSGCKLMQPPGPANSLGQVKFIFPNKYQVYIHDTPMKPLFNKAERAFSSGCIRIEHPLELAERLLAPNTGMDKNWLRKQVASKQTQAIKLPRPIPVLLLYYTAEAGDDGMIFFRNDLYERDQTVLRALNAEAGFFPGIDNITWKN